LAIKVAFRLHTLQAGMYTSLKLENRDDTLPEHQLPVARKKAKEKRNEKQARATKKHCELKRTLAEQHHKVCLHRIRSDVMETILTRFTELPLNYLGLNPCQVRKLTLHHATPQVLKLPSYSKTRWMLKSRFLNCQLQWRGSMFLTFKVKLTHFGTKFCEVP